MRSLHRGSKEIGPETKTPRGNTDKTTDTYRRPPLRRSRILGSATGLFVMLPGAATGQESAPAPTTPVNEGQQNTPAQTAQSEPFARASVVSTATSGRVTMDILAPFQGRSFDEYYDGLRTFLFTQYPGITSADSSKEEVKINAQSGCNSLLSLSEKDPFSKSFEEDGLYVATGGIRRVDIKPKRNDRSKVNIRVEARSQVTDGALDGYNESVDHWYSAAQRTSCHIFGRRQVKISLWKAVKKKNSKVTKLYPIKSPGSSKTLTINDPSSYTGPRDAVTLETTLRRRKKDVSLKGRWYIGIQNKYPGIKDKKDFTSVVTVPAKPKQYRVDPVERNIFSLN